MKFNYKDELALSALRTDGADNDAATRGRDYLMVRVLDGLAMHALNRLRRVHGGTPFRSRADYYRSAPPGPTDRIWQNANLGTDVIEFRDADEKVLSVIEDQFRKRPADVLRTTADLFDAAWDASPRSTGPEKFLAGTFQRAAVAARKAADLVEPKMSSERMTNRMSTRLLRPPTLSKSELAVLATEPGRLVAVDYLSKVPTPYLLAVSSALKEAAEGGTSLANVDQGQAGEIWEAFRVANHEIVNGATAAFAHVRYPANHPMLDRLTDRRNGLMPPVAGSDFVDAIKYRLDQTGRNTDFSEGYVDPVAGRERPAILPGPRQTADTMPTSGSQATPTGPRTLTS